MANQQNKGDLQIDTAVLKEAGMTFRALNNKLRQKILQLIHQGERVYVGEVYKKLKIPQSVASQHLAILRSQDLVRSEKQGHFVFYSVNYIRIEQLHKLAKSVSAAQD